MISKSLETINNQVRYYILKFIVWNLEKNVSSLSCGELNEKLACLCPKMFLTFLSHYFLAGTSNFFVFPLVTWWVRNSHAHGPAQNGKFLFLHYNYYTNYTNEMQRVYKRTLDELVGRFCDLWTQPGELFSSCFQSSCRAKLTDCWL